MLRALKPYIQRLRNLLLSPFVLADYHTFESKDATKRFAYSWKTFFPQIFDKTFGTGFDRHYVYHTAWAARKVKEYHPEKHIDISSSLYFSGMVSTFIPVEFYDYRPAPLKLSNLTTGHADLTSLHFASDSIRSLSCMHVVEHIGLGRYGDPIDPDGDIKACAELSRVLAPEGRLLFVVPIGGTALIEFNAHRIYTHDLVLSLFPTLHLTEFSYIPEQGPDGIKENADPATLSAERYACGLFVFTKLT
jgi:SAM-dependent methyltransferase